jgi:hypothetical protein
MERSENGSFNKPRHGTFLNKHSRMPGSDELRRQIIALLLD